MPRPQLSPAQARAKAMMQGHQLGKWMPRRPHGYSIATCERCGSIAFAPDGAGINPAVEQRCSGRKSAADTELRSQQLVDADALAGANDGDDSAGSSIITDRAASLAILDASKEKTAGPAIEPAPAAEAEESPPAAPAIISSMPSPAFIVPSFLGRK